MSMIIESNNIHLIGNVENGIIDEYVMNPFFIGMEMIKSTNPEVINLHLSGRDTTFEITPIVEVIKSSEVPVDIYIRNSELYRGWNGIDGSLLSLLDKVRNVIDYKNVEYNPPFHLSVPEIQIMREYDFYNKGVYDDDEDDELNY